MNDQFMKWVDATKDIANRSEECKCPECGHKGLEFQYVGDKERNLGHVYIWCNSCKHGIHISRTRIPDGVDLLPMNVSAEEIEKRVPKYELVS
ncbi:hypothetical protein [Candidatus Thiodiazotropha endoloripes]|uniref:hypothetical protein n=1 Tax=Candidatus Thiodiazotropha endoloripes TaxID=1818881 RepID=UPI001112C53B|nr:hypothetical protein [Candidatus Thiodiazotropha endoloripes]